MLINIFGTAEITQTSTLCAPKIFSNKSFKYKKHRNIGRTKSNEILSACKIDPNIRVKDLTEEQATLIRNYIDKNLKVEGELRTQISMDIKRLQEIGCYRGIRHRRNLPVRGQRSKTNARTRKGPKKTVSRGKSK